MGQTSSCFGYEPKKKPKEKEYLEERAWSHPIYMNLVPQKHEKSTVRFEEVGTIEMAEVPNASQNETTRCQLLLDNRFRRFF